MASAKRTTRILLAIVLGEIALVLLTTLAQEVLFDGIDYYFSSDSDIFFGGLATFVASVLAGVIAALVVRGSTFIPHIVISLIIVTETTYLILSASLPGPLWFDILSGCFLIVGLWAGHYAARTFIFKP